jgi:hypothetical protein
VSYMRLSLSEKLIHTFIEGSESLKKSNFTTDQLVALTLMKMKLNLSYEALGGMFNFRRQIAA